MPEETPAKKTPAFPRLTLVAIVLLLAVAAVILILDRNQLSSLLKTSNPRWLIWAFACVAVSYLSGATSFLLLMRVFGVKLRASHLRNLGLVSLCMCNVVGSPTDIMLRVLFLGRHGVKNSDIVSASFLMQYLKDMTYYILVPASLLWIGISHPLPSYGTVTLITIGAVIATAIAILTSILFSARLRRPVLTAVQKVWRAVTHRDIGVHLERFNQTLSEGTSNLLKHKRQIPPVLATTFGEIGGIILSLWFCFKALGVAVSPWVMLTGFNLGVTLGLFGFIPGRIGVQEATMAGVLALFGIPITVGAIVALVFRVVYYLIPFIVTLPVYWSLFRERVGENTNS
jgi:uncharacterized protein (TIRG00374 family)